MPSSKKKKICKMEAAAIINKFARGWLVRYSYLRMVDEAFAQKITIREMISNYRKHLREIMTRHGEDDSFIRINFFEVYDYLKKKQRYETAFDRFSEDGKLMLYDQLPGYFDSLGLRPTTAEIRFAAEALLDKNKAAYKTFDYGKQEVLDISLHIYVPLGTGLRNKRVSTWMCPLVDNDDALRYDLDENDAKKIKLSKCINIVSGAFKNYKYGEKIYLSKSQELLAQLKDQSKVDGNSSNEAKPKVTKKTIKKKKK